MKHQQTAGSATHESKAKKPPAKSKAANSAKAAGSSSAQPEVVADGAGRVEMIRQTAYGFYEARGCIAGYELEDWLQAEEKVNQVIAGSQASASSTASLQLA